MLGTVPNVRIATLVGEGRVITVSLDAYGENIVETCGSMQHKLAAMRTNLQRSGKYMITLEENGVNRGTDTLIMPQAILNGTGLSADIETASNIIERDG